MSNKLVLSFSGGADSTVLLYMAAAQGIEEIHTLTFDYGQRHIREIACVHDQMKNVTAKYGCKVFNRILDVSYIKAISPTSSLTNLDINNPKIAEIAGDAQPVSYVPFRNQMFLSICCAYAESLKVPTVWYGAAQVDSLAGYWDGSQEFLNSVNALVSLNRANRINIEAPLLTMSKSAIVTQGVRLGVDFSKTWTCYSNEASGLADASTPSSSLRLRGFIEAGYQDPIQYIQQDAINRLYCDNNCISLEG